MTTRQPLAWGARVSNAFRARVWAICDAFEWVPEQASFLMACMAFESGETFSPSIRNAAGSGAVGLIQFMPLTAHDLGTTTLRLMGMTSEAQLDFVEKYFRPYHMRIRSLSDTYMAILLPKYVGADEDTVLFSDGVIYRQNAGLDANSDGNVTKAEAAAHVRAKLERGLLPGNVFTDRSDT